MALYRCIGNGGGVTPTDITPSNASPASMSADGVYKATAAGYAIESYNSKTPSNASPVALVSGEIDKMGGAGYAIERYSNVTPSDSTPVAFSSGDICKMGGAGYAIASSPTSITPSTSTPATITSGNIYKASGNGYAIYSYTSKTPTSAGVAFQAGFVKMSSNGYAFSEIPSVSSYTNPLSSISTAATMFTIRNMTGKKLLVLLFYQAGSATAYNRLDGATCGYGTLTKLCNLRETNGNAYGTFYNLSPTADNCVVTAPYACFMQVFGTE